MSSITLDNGIELYGTHEEGDGGIEYRISAARSRCPSRSASRDMPRDPEPDVRHWQRSRRARRIDARTGGRSPGAAPRRRQQRAARRRWRAITESGSCRRRREDAPSAIPSCCVDWQPSGAVHFTRRAWAKFQAPGRYSTTVTQPAFFRQYLLEQLRPLAEEFGATHRGRHQRRRRSLSLRHRGGRRIRPWRSLGGRAGASFPDARARQCRRRDRRRHLAVSEERRAAAARPVRRAARRFLAAPAASTIPAPTGARSSPGSCSPTTSATSISS